jgi:hypothetical protein
VTHFENLLFKKGKAHQRRRARWWLMPSKAVRLIW